MAKRVLSLLIYLSLLISWLSLVLQLETGRTVTTSWGASTFIMEPGSNYAKFKLMGSFFFIVAGMWACFLEKFRTLAPGRVIMLGLLMVSAFIWQIISYPNAEQWLYSLLLNTGPFIWAMCLGVFAGGEPKIWIAVRRCAWIIACGSLVLALRYYLTLKHTVYFDTGSPLVMYLVHAFWFSAFLFIQSKTKKAFVLAAVLMVGCLLVAILGGNRSWALQSLLTILFGIGAFFTKGSKSFSFAKFSIGGIVGLFLLMVFISSLPMGFSSRLTNRMFEDTRTSQYKTFFNQVSAGRLVLGYGPNATYRMGSNRNYEYFDNQFIFILYKFGLPVAISYFFLLLLPGLLMLKYTKNIEMFSIGYLFMIWLMALLGVSVYNAVGHTAYNYLIVLLSGRAYAIRNELSFRKRFRRRSSGLAYT